MKARRRANRIHALNNTYSGLVGEMAIATALLRCGYKVAKPYWNNDVMDLLIVSRDESGHHLCMPIQVKSIQKLTSESQEVAVQGLKKHYVERQPGLCLGIYSPELNKIWFIAGSHNIRKVHHAGLVASKKRPGASRIPYEALKLQDDVSIYVNLSAAGNPKLDKWLVNPEKPCNKLAKLVQGLISRMQVDHSVFRAAGALIDLYDEDLVNEEAATETMKELNSK